MGVGVVVVGGLTISYHHQKFWALCPWCITVRYKTPVLQTMTRSKIIWGDNLWSLYSLKTFMFSWTSLLSQPMCKYATTFLFGMTTVSAVHKFMYPWNSEFSKLRNIAVLLLSTAQHVLYQNEGRISCLQIYI